MLTYTRVVERERERQAESERVRVRGKERSVCISKTRKGWHKNERLGKANVRSHEASIIYCAK